MLKVNTVLVPGVYGPCIRIRHFVSSRIPCTAALYSGVLLACPRPPYPSQIDLNFLLFYKLVWDDFV